MIKIKTPQYVNEISLGSSKNETNDIDLKKEDIFLEFENDKIIAISIRNEPRFELNGEIIDIKKINLLFEKENPYYDGDCYILPNLNICIYLKPGETNYELTLYDSSKKSLYESNLESCARYTDTLPREVKKNTGLTFTPYKGIDRYMFSMSEKEVEYLAGNPLFKATGVRDKVVYNYGHMQFRFDKGLLTQVMIDYNEISLAERSSILVKFTDTKDLDIVSCEGLISIKNTSPFLERTGYVVWPDLGFSVDKPNSKGCSNEFFFFDASLKPFWMNKNRPITSW